MFNKLNEDIKNAMLTKSYQSIADYEGLTIVCDPLGYSIDEKNFFVGILDDECGVYIAAGYFNSETDWEKAAVWVNEVIETYKQWIEEDEEDPDNEAAKELVFNAVKEMVVYYLRENDNGGYRVKPFSMDKTTIWEAYSQPWFLKYLWQNMDCEGIAWAVQSVLSQALDELGFEYEEDYDFDDGTEVKVFAENLPVEPFKSMYQE